MAFEVNRKDFLRLAGVGSGVVFASRIAGWNEAFGANAPEFYFVQMSDTHWGFQGPPNPEAQNTLPRAVAAVNALKEQPDFIVFTGDLIHTTDDDKERQRRMMEFKSHASNLKVKNVKFLAGEHDAGVDNGGVYRSVFGEPNYSFEHKGAHFIAIDNVSDPSASIGEKQLEWLRADLSKLDKSQPIVVLTHRPLFDLYPEWDWATKDGAKAMEILAPYEHVTVFYGHIHQENHKTIGKVSHHAAAGLMFPLPAPGSQPKRAPVPWDAAHPFKGLGFRELEVAGASVKITESSIA